MRLDVFLFEKGIAKSRSQASQIISGGIVYNGKIIKKPAYNIPDNLDSSCLTVLNPFKYVSRGGYKLEYAIEYFKLDVSNKVVLDLGSSTGGFADCLIKYGAKKVVCIDVGTNQLDESLKNDSEHIVCLENTDARSLNKGMFDSQFEIITSDLSFISQSKVYSVVFNLLCDNGIFVSLIKPQFELDKSALSKKGIVIDKKNHIKAIKNLIELGKDSGLYLNSLSCSPIEGGDGNIEYLAIFTKNNTNIISEKSIMDVVYKK